MNTRRRIPALPSEYDVHLSDLRKFDNYYSLSREVECVIQRLDRELPEGFLARPRTINRSISLFRYAEFIGSIDFDCVEDFGVVAALDAAHRMVHSWGKQT